MTSPKESLSVLPSVEHFRNHPDSIAGRLHNQQLENIWARLRAHSAGDTTSHGPDWLDLTLESSPEEVDAAYRNTFERHGPERRMWSPQTNAHGDSDCPLDPSWNLWDLFRPHRYHDAITSEQWQVCARARCSQPVRHRKLVALTWSLAVDDARYARMPSAHPGDAEWRRGENSSQHAHAEADIDGVMVHIDRVAATRYGPGRSFVEFRIYAAGRLAGRGGWCGCSLGFGGTELPAVAVIHPGLAVTVDEVHANGEPMVELWEVMESKRYTLRR
jgi:hypothetical protein